MNSGGKGKLLIRLTDSVLPREPPGPGWGKVVLLRLPRFNRDLFKVDPSGNFDGSAL